MELFAVLFGSLVPGLVLAAIGVVKVRKYLRRGPRRLLLGSLVVALLASPSVLEGHGIAFFPALLALIVPLDMAPVPFYAEPLWLGVLPMTVTGIVAFAIGGIAAGIGRLSRAGADAEVVQGHLSEAQERRVLRAVAVAMCLLIVTGFAERWYLAEYRASYGPFIVEVQTDGQSLDDILVGIVPDRFREHYANSQRRLERIARSGHTVEFGPTYLGAGYTEVTFRIYVQHPLLPWDFATQVTVPVRPHTRVMLPSIHVPPWSDAELRAVHAGSKVPPILKQVTDPIDRVDRVILSDFSDFSLRYVPSFCHHDDLERVKRYIPPIALAWTRVNFGDTTAEPAPGYVEILAKDFDITCRTSPRATVSVD